MLLWQIMVMIVMAGVAAIALWGTAKNRREDAQKKDQ